MANNPVQFIELASGASGILTGLASSPTTADNIIFRVDIGTVRWSETTGSFLTASSGLLMSAVDSPIRLTNPSAFKVYPMGGGAAVQVLYYKGFFSL